MARKLLILASREPIPDRLLDEVLYAVPFDLGRLEAVGGAVPMVERVSGSTIQYAVADSGSLVYMLGGAVLDSRILALGACRE